MAKKETNNKGMVITRKITLHVNEDDKTLRSEHYKTLRTWSNTVRKAANVVMSHKFAQQNIRDFIYIKDEIIEKFFVKDIIKEGKGMSEQNTTYRILSDMCKGNMPSDIYSCLNSVLAQSYAARFKDMTAGRMSCPSFRNDIPMPFSKNPLSKIKIIEREHEGKIYEAYTFDWFGIPFWMHFGKDKSRNRELVDFCLAEEMVGYDFAQSSIGIDRSGTITLFLCIKVPIKTNKGLDENKVCTAQIGFLNPIVAQAQGKRYPYGIGSREEFLSIRTHIQGALKRAQISARFSKGGKGRNRKLGMIDRFKEKEKNYVKTMMHVYSKKLIDYCLENKCGTLSLISVSKGEDGYEYIDECDKRQVVKENPYLLRNWSYSGMLGLIEYKCKLNNINLIKPKNDDTEESEH